MKESVKRNAIIDILAYLHKNPDSMGDVIVNIAKTSPMILIKTIAKMGVGGICPTTDSLSNDDVLQHLYHVEGITLKVPLIKEFRRLRGGSLKDAVDMVNNFLFKNNP